MQSQAHKIMANFLSRQIHCNQAKGFYTWLDNLKDHKGKKRFLRNTINYWTKNSLAKGFRTWADHTLKNKEKELAEHLLRREGERRQLQRQKEEEDK
jgi:hypothetical protein